MTQDFESKYKDIVDILRETNKREGLLIDDSLILQIIALEVEKPLPDDRKNCQDRIKILIDNKIEEEENDNKQY